MSDELPVPNVEEMRSAAETDNPYGAMEPDEFDRGIAQVRADTLREAASALRTIAGYSPYVGVSQGMGADGWGNQSEDIDDGYAEWLNERADQDTDAHARSIAADNRSMETLLHHLWETTDQDGFQPRAGDLCVYKDSAGRFSVTVPDNDPVLFDGLTVIAKQGDYSRRECSAWGLHR